MGCGAEESLERGFICPVYQSVVILGSSVTCEVGLLSLSSSCLAQSLETPTVTTSSLSHFQAGMQVWHQLWSVTRRGFSSGCLYMSGQSGTSATSLFFLSLVSPQCGCPPHSSRVACVPGCGRVWVCWELHRAVEFGMFLWTVRRWGGAAVTALSSDVQG